MNQLISNAMQTTTAKIIKTRPGQVKAKLLLEIVLYVRYTIISHGFGTCSWQIAGEN